MSNSGRCLPGAAPTFVVGGHTHDATDRVVDGIRALNPGTAGLPRGTGTAGWLLLDDDGDALSVTQHSTPFDVDAVVGDLRLRRHPNAEFIASILVGGAEAPRGRMVQG